MRFGRPALQRLGRDVRPGLAPDKVGDHINCLLRKFVHLGNRTSAGTQVGIVG